MADTPNVTVAAVAFWADQKRAQCFHFEGFLLTLEETASHCVGKWLCHLHTDGCQKGLATSEPSFGI